MLTLPLDVCNNEQIEVNVFAPVGLMRCGKKRFLLPMLKRALPDRMLDAILSRRFQLDRLRQSR